MSSTMLTGRVILPAIGLLVGVSLLWQSARTMIVRPEIIPSEEAARSVAPSSGRVSAEGRVVACPGAEVTVATEVLGTIISMPVRERVTVRKGDLIAELRAEDVKASL